MDQILNTQGFQHIVENIFLNLNYEDLLFSQLINNSCKKIIENPMFWLKKWRKRGLSKENEEDWANAIQITRNNPNNEEINALSYIKMVIKMGHFVDVPCYIITERKKLKKFMKKFPSAEFSIQFRFREAYYRRNTGMLQILAPLVKSILDLGSTDAMFCSYMYNVLYRLNTFTFAAYNGHTDVIKVLAPLSMKCQQSKMHYFSCAIILAVKSGHVEIIKFLAPLAENCNMCRFVFTMNIEPNQDVVADANNEIKKILQSYVK